MAHNRYYIINASDPDILQIEEVIVGVIQQQRPSLDKTQIVVKLHEGNHNDYPVLSQYTEYNHENILIAMRTPEWTPPEIF